MARLVFVAIVCVVVLTSLQARAAPTQSCPSRSAIIDSLRGSVVMSDAWLVVTLGSVVGLSAAYGGVGIGVVAALAGGGWAAVSGMRTMDQLDHSVRAALPEIASRFHRSPDDLYDQVAYAEQVIAGHWLTRVGGAVVGGVAGMLAPWEIWPFQGVRRRVLIGTAVGATLGGFWHRWAIWPFFDDVPVLCRAVTSSTRT